MAQKNIQVIDGPWHFQKEGSDHWMPAEVPGSVQWNLLKLDSIPNPFIGTNEDSVQWIENHRWVFTSTFSYSPSKRKRKKEVLKFNGLDTYAQVLLNGSMILDADNMHRTWEVDVSDLLLPKNVIEVIFTSPKDYHKESSLSKIKTLPHDGVPERPLTRKAAYHFGWDWGPRIVTMGIWKPIVLLSTERNSLRNVTVETTEIAKTSVAFNAKIRLDNIQSTKARVTISLDDEVIHESDLDELETVFELKQNNSTLWRPNNWGKAQLHDLRVELYEGRDLVDVWEEKIGFRTAELIQEKDSMGTSFYFKINGDAVFCKGANYIPMSPFVGNHSDEEYRELLISASEANINMLRVWGGGIYEQDIFYDLCDSLGIMVWQDFMFANTMYVSELNKSIESEIQDNIQRLAHHPSIVHWCGNNEIHVAWSNWGWQNQYKISESDSAQLIQNYDLLFNQVIPENLKEILPAATYSHSSPLSNWGTEENFNQGSMHYWGVFHGEDPFSDYAHNVGRFTSEYGFQTFPTWNSLQYIFGEDKPDMDSEILSQRQKSYKGNRLIFQHLERHFPKPETMMELSYLSQINQARGVGYAVQNHRINQPHSMGSLFWQFNDTWPAISWSSIEYNGERRALYFEIKESFNDPGLFIDTLNNGIDAVLVNDRGSSIDGILEYCLMDTQGKKYQSYSIKMEVNSNDLGRYSLDELFPLLEELDRRETLLFVTYRDSTNLVSLIHSFLSPKDLILYPTQIEIETSIIENIAFIKLRSDVLALKVQLHTPITGQFSNNYIDLMPGTEILIEFTSEESLADFEQSLSLLNLNQIVIESREEE